MDTKACNLTEDEIRALIQYHGRQIANHTNIESSYIERLNYLHKRLKAFNEAETKPVPAPIPQPAAWPNN